MNIHTPATELRTDPGARAPETSICTQLAEFAANLAAGDIPDDRRQRAVHHMLDAAGIALASTRYDFAHKTLAGLKALGGTPAGAGASVGVFGMPARLSPRDAATMNGFLCHGLDYDDTHIGGIVHPTASVFPAVISAAAMSGASGRDAVTAYVIGIETACRLGMVAKGGFHQVGFHPTGMIGVFGCTLAAGRLLGLSAGQLRHAQGLALSMAAASLQFLEDGAWNKRIHPGWAAQCGLTAAALAREGFVGAKDAYDGRFGVFAMYLGQERERADLALATAGLGEAWELDRVAIKPFPTCHFTHAAIDCAIALRDRIGGAHAIERIEVLVPPETMKTICEPAAAKKRPQNDYDTKFSTHVLVATGLIKGRLSLAELEPVVFTNSDVLALADKVVCSPDPNSAFPKAYSGEVRITLNSGETVTHREHINRGADERPLSNDEIIAKFDDNAALLLNREALARARDTLLGLETAERATDAVAPLTPSWS